MAFMAAKVEGEVERVQEVGGKGRGRGSLLVNLAAKRAKVEEEDVEDEDMEEGDVEEDLTKFTKDELVMFKTLWKLRDCAGPAEERDNVTMIM